MRGAVDVIASSPSPHVCRRRTCAFPGDAADPSVRCFFPVSLRSPPGADTRLRSPPYSPRSRSSFSSKTCKDTSIGAKNFILKTKHGNTHTHTFLSFSTKEEPEIPASAYRKSTPNGNQKDQPITSDDLTRRAWLASQIPPAA